MSRSQPQPATAHEAMARLAQPLGDGAVTPPVGLHRFRHRTDPGAVASNPSELAGQALTVDLDDALPVRVSFFDDLGV